MSMRLKPYELIPARWFVGGTIEAENGDEYSFFVLRLPSWRYDHALWHDGMEWKQLAWFYHGRDGFSLRWMTALS
jgi:hypothetical protein